MASSKAGAVEQEQHSGAGAQAQTKVQGGKQPQVKLRMQQGAKTRIQLRLKVWLQRQGGAETGRQLAEQQPKMPFQVQRPTP